MECIAKMDQEANVTFGVNHLSLRERLEGWKVEIRLRESNRRRDKFFYHKKSGMRFRSFIEVETFIIHAPFPKWEKQNVEKFLEEAWNNLQNTDWQMEDVPSSSTNYHGARIIDTPAKSSIGCITLKMVEECLERENNKLLSNENHAVGIKEVPANSSNAFITLEMVSAYLEKDQNKLACKNLQSSSDSEETTPCTTPKAGNECVRRFYDQGLDVPLGEEAVDIEVEQEMEVEHILRSSDNAEVDKKWKLSRS